VAKGLNLAGLPETDKRALALKKSSGLATRLKNKSNYWLLRALLLRLGLGAKGWEGEGSGERKLQEKSEPHQPPSRGVWKEGRG